MRVFHTDVNSFETKVNFVDENNVVLGFEVDYGCGNDTHPGWFIADRPTEQLLRMDCGLYYRDENDTSDHYEGEPIYRMADVLPDPENWVFDTTYFKKMGDIKYNEKQWAWFQKEYPSLSEDEDERIVLHEGEMVVFRITNGTDFKYIHLFNEQNGYYTHGFKMCDGTEVIKEGGV